MITLLLKIFIACFSLSINLSLELNYVKLDDIKEINIKDLNKIIVSEDPLYQEVSYTLILNKMLEFANA